MPLYLRCHTLVWLVVACVAAAVVLPALLAKADPARLNEQPTPPPAPPTAPALSAAASATVAADFARVARPFLEQHCLECHDDTTQKGGVRLDTLAADFASPESVKRWTDVHDALASGEMPPKKKARPAKSDADRMLGFVAGGLTAADEARHRSAGRVVLRRLNRAEYENTVRDLLGVDVDVKDLLPEDTAALGFDNVAAALNVSPVLMERYLEAADVALDAAVNFGPAPAAQTWTVSASPDTTNPKDYRFNTGVTTLADGAFVFFNSGETPIVTDRFKAPAPGRYRFRVTAYAHQSPGRPVVMNILAGSFDQRNPKRRTIGFFDVPPTPDQPRVVEFVEPLPKRGTIKIMAAETGTKGVRANAAEYKGPGLAIARVEVEGPLHDTWPPPGHQRLFGDVDVKTAGEKDVEGLLAPFAARAFRRPVTREDVRPYVELAASQLREKVPFEAAVRAAAKAVLCSPDFLFLQERPGRLDDHALSARLSYFLWSSMPDEELTRVAASGTLARPEVLRQQSERMLKDSRAGAFTENFTGQWLGLRQIDFTTPDKKLYPEFDDQLQWSMLEETRRFFDAVLGGDLSLLAFVDSDFSYLNGRLARHYGIEGVSGNELRRTPLPPGSHRGGVLAHASVLKVTANGTTTSPVVRGAWVMRNIVGRPPKPPPPNVPAVEPDIRGASTIREQLEKHRSLGACASCHLKMDPPGNALERFDVIGGWRDNYRSLGDGKPLTITVDGRPTRLKVGPKVDPADRLADGRAFDDFDAFKKLLAADGDQVARCLTEKLITYATGAGVDFADRRVVDGILQNVRGRQYGFRSLVHEVVQSRAFLEK